MCARQAAEAAQRRAEEEAGRFRASASAASELQQRAERELESRSAQLQESLQEREAEVGSGGRWHMLTLLRFALTRVHRKQRFAPFDGTAAPEHCYIYVKGRECCILT